MKPVTGQKLYAFFALIILSIFIFISISSCQKDTSAAAEKTKDVMQTNDALKTSPIIYADVNPDITMISNSVSRRHVYNLDLNGDGTTDFTINDFCSVGPFFSCGVNSTALSKNAVASNVALPLAMNFNDTIAPDLHWIVNTALALRVVSKHGTEVPYQWLGTWTTASEHYLGLKIHSGGNNYYGWMRLDVSVSVTASSFTIKDYAYNSVPNQPILAGQTE